MLGDLLGIGGMGQVYCAVGADGSPLALKLLHPAHASDPAMIARLGDEALAGIRVSHPNVVRIVDHGTTATGGAFLVMDRVAGTSLGAILWREGALPLRRIRSITSQILAGLAAIHRAGLVHGDLKCDNVLVDSSGGIDRVTIIDLGLAREPGTHPACDDEQILSGTPEYVAPELIRGVPITPAADLYAVGVIVYELLTGATPFAGGDASMIFERQLHDDIVPPSLRCPDRVIPPALEEVVMRALAKDPAARHRDASTFAIELERSMRPDVDDTPRVRARSESSTDSPTRDWMSDPRARPERRRWLAKGTPRNREDCPDDEAGPRCSRRVHATRSRRARARAFHFPDNESTAGAELSSWMSSAARAACPPVTASRAGRVYARKW
jgi:serine/threonine-protein kinase